MMTRVTNGAIGRRVDDTGNVWFSGDDATELLLRGYDVASLLIDPTPEIEVYNQWCVKMNKAAYAIQSLAPESINRLDTWWITEPYRDLPVQQLVLQRCTTEVQRNRVLQEMELFEAHGLMPVLRLMYMLIAHFRQNNIVWGVGRGSSVASYVLFIIGVHKVDSLAYGLDISEFLHD